jgi:hypothetical protein
LTLSRLASRSLTSLGHSITLAGDFSSHKIPMRVQGLEKKIVIKAAADWDGPY